MKFGLGGGVGGGVGRGEGAGDIDARLAGDGISEGVVARKGTGRNPLSPIGGGWCPLIEMGGPGGSGPPRILWGSKFGS